MAGSEPLSITIEGKPIRKMAGDTAVIEVEAKGGNPDYTYAWSRTDGEVDGSTDSAGNLTLKVTHENAGVYKVKVTDSAGQEATDTAAIEVQAQELPPIWPPAKFVGGVTAILSGGFVLLALPALILAWRGASDTDMNPRAVVAAMLVTAGLAALVVAAFLFLIDYRGRAVEARVLSSGNHRFGFDPAPVLKEATAFAKAMGPLRGAAALVLAAAFAFGAAAWAVSNTPAAGSGKDDPKPAASASPSPTGQ